MEKKTWSTSNSVGQVVSLETVEGDFLNWDLSSEPEDQGVEQRGKI